MLDHLGYTAEEVALSLRSAGIKGERKSQDACPLCLFLSAKAPGCDPRAYGSLIELLEKDGMRVLHSLPPAVAEFKARFEKGWYQELTR